jgi:hypothetical protein
MLIVIASPSLGRGVEDLRRRPQGTGRISTRSEGSEAVGGDEAISVWVPISRTSATLSNTTRTPFEGSAPRGHWHAMPIESGRLGLAPGSTARAHGGGVRLARADLLRDGTAKALNKPYP